MEGIRIRVHGELVSISPERVPALARADQVLPVLKHLDDQLVSIALKKHRGVVACRRGCSACCRVQPVPVTPAEAFEVFLIVENLPHPRKSGILQRFREVESRLESAGFREMYLEGRRPADEEEGKRRAREYLDLRLACPFLEEDDSCGIYERRPLACREYYVSSPSELCDDPIGARIEVIPMLAHLTDAALKVANEISGGGQFLIPLTLAMAYVQMNRTALERTFSGTELLGRSVAAALSFTLSTPEDLENY